MAVSLFAACAFHHNSKFQCDEILVSSVNESNELTIDGIRFVSF